MICGFPGAPGGTLSGGRLESTLGAGSFYRLANRLRVVMRGAQAPKQLAAGSEPSAPAPTGRCSKAQGVGNKEEAEACFGSCLLQPRSCSAPLESVGCGPTGPTLPDVG